MTQSALFSAVERARQFLVGGKRAAKNAESFGNSLDAVFKRSSVFLRGDRALHMVPPRTAKQLELLEAEARGLKRLDPAPDLYRMIAGNAAVASTAFGDMTVRGVALILSRLHTTPEWGLLSIRTWIEVSTVTLTAVMNSSVRTVNRLLKNSPPNEESLKGTLAVLNGLLREVRGRNLESIRAVVQGIRRRALEQGLELIDSAELGAVRSWSRDRQLRLGTDRLVGVGKRYQTPVSLQPTRPGDGPVSIVGKLKIELAVEVKSRTGQVEGVEQLSNLQRRATGTTGGDTIIEIGGELWHIEYVPKDVVHVVVAPGADLEDATTWARQATKATDELNTRGVPTLLLTFPKKLDEEVQACSNQLLNLVVSIATRLVNAK